MVLRQWWLRWHFTLNRHLVILSTLFYMRLLIMVIEDKRNLNRCLFLYSTVVFTLVFLLQIYRQLFLSHPFGAQKGAKGTAQNKISRRILCSGIFVNENIPRSSAPCRQLSLESRGSVKFGRTLKVRQKTCPSFPQLYCGRCL